MVLNNIAAIIIIISRTGNGLLYCRSKDLQQSLDQPTPFCTFTGEYKLKRLLFYIYKNQTDDFQYEYILILIQEQLLTTVCFSWPCCGCAIWWHCFGR